MTLFVDYDNVLHSHRRAGTVALVERVIAKVFSLGVPAGTRVHGRLYGGWYEATSLSRKAQHLAAELASEFPTILDVPVQGKRMPATVELALSLDVDPATHLHHTFRRQSPPADVRCREPRRLGCQIARCPMVHTWEMLRSGCCPEPSCRNTRDQLLFRSAQKLVDTMLTADVMSVALRSSDLLVIVSSDDDLWPAIQTALALGRQLVHVHTRSGGAARLPYIPLPRGGYAAVDLA